MTRRSPSPWPTLLLLALGLCSACGGGVDEGSGTGAKEGQVDLFARDVQPVLEQKCAGAACHSSGAAGAQYLLVSGASSADYLSLMARVTPHDADGSQILKSMGGPMLSSSERALLAAWIDAGAMQFGPAGSGPPPVPTAAAMGLDYCTSCHFGQVRQWLVGGHGNLGETGTLDSGGFPSYDHPVTTSTPEGCYLACHDPQGDGHLVVAGWTGNVPRPVVGCESCHGEGSEHFAAGGKGSLPYPKPEPAQCGRCHNASFAHNAEFPEGDRILESYSASPHARSVNEHTRPVGSAVSVTALCSRCHTDEGAKRYRTLDGDPNALQAALGTASPLAAASPVQCRTCHNGHEPRKLLLEPTIGTGGAVVESAEYRTCTLCHQTGDAYHGELSTTAWTVGTAGERTFEGNRVFYDTHFDDPLTTYAEGYVLDPASSRVCRDCHNVHASDNTIQNQWASSAHGGHILQVKARAAAESLDTAAVITAVVGDEDAPGWVHYDFKISSRASCQRCHTATGAANYLNDPAAYTSSMNSNPSSEFRFTATGLQKELLYCWACHTDNAGGMRNPGAVTVDYGYTIGTSFGIPAPVALPVSYAYPDLKASNVCMGCHTGRQAGATIQAAAAAIPIGTFGFANLGFVNSHYLAAGGTVFGVTGYEFPGRDYANPALYAHDRVGSPAAPGTGGSGPCVGCHFTAAPGQPVDHLLKTVTLDEETGEVTAIRSPACAVCHKVVGTEDHTQTAAKLHLQKELLHAAMEALDAQLRVRGLHFYEASPYFYTAPYDPEYVEDYSNSDGDADACSKNLPVKNWNTGGTSSFTPRVTSSSSSCNSRVAVAGTDGTGSANMGAAFNYNLLHHDPGAYAHNRWYAKRLIYDSIDWLDDNVLNDSTLATLEGLPEDTPYRADAVEYLSELGR